MPIKLIADTDDDEQGFVLYDPAAVAGDVEPEIGGWEDKRDTLAVDGRAAVHVADGGFMSPDNPGTERRFCWVCVEEELPEELAGRARLVVEGARLQVPSGRLYFCGAFAARSDGPPVRDGERYGEAEIPPGDYHLDIYLADWREGERERFVDERCEPSDRAHEHNVGCLGMFAVAVSVIAPLLLVFGYLVLPTLSHHGLHPDTWKWTLAVLGPLWMGVFLLNRTPGQKRLIAARQARDALGLPTVIYVLSRGEPGDRPAFFHEAASEPASRRGRAS